jgi:hypothetical protein
MKGFATFEHAQELREPTLPPVSSLGLMQSIENRVSVLAIELLERAPGPRVSPQRFLKIAGNGPALRLPSHALQRAPSVPPPAAVRPPRS